MPSTTRRDYYEILGVQRDADGTVLKRAYRKLAMQYHPDRNPDAEASGRFKEATEAYAVLSDPDKRRLYDMGGHAAVEGGGFDPGAYADLGDLFGGVLRDLFGGGDPFGGSRRRGGPRRGEDLLHPLTLTFEEAALGSGKELHVPNMGDCEECTGSGAAPGTGRVTCSDCGGRGQIVVRQGFFAMSRTCGRCRGTGQALESPCEGCGGAMRVPRESSLKIRVPAGIAEGQRIRVQGEGEPGERGGPPGDLYVQVAVIPHEHFWREGFDLHVQLSVSFPQAALGARLEVPTLHEPVSLDVPPGTETGKVLRTRGKGIKRLGGSGHGDLLAHVRVRTPRQLSPEQADLIRELAATLDDEGELGERSLFDRVKDIFN